MCLIGIALNAHEKYPFILVANRDEFYERPTERAHFWEDEPEILAGRDLKAMGTWLGVTTTGKIAALTNYREPGEKPQEKSRGDLPLDYLRTNLGINTYLEDVNAKRTEYNGFNLIAGHFNELYYYSNRQNEIKQLQDGIHGLSNHLLNTSWPKVDRLKDDISCYLSQNAEIDINQLFEMLNQADPASDDALPETGVPIEWERMLSPIFIASDSYGTRAQTVITVTNQGQVTFTERSKGQKNDERYFEFSINHS
ncbi:NRDE family protein [Pseudalkalibacillus hwajinpoensis]|uniref:NRDE family protein n=1 Tax=Guptibacillus hwajinpoensis TaxID=208199 RepID=A0A4U1MJD3_9BACL|nr:NRDE family protein [Pseudalkalibacillus hwajinpoensis]TKD71519.1 NRDE family protein [Pseudalkalibacillus hwajinpoensis]